MPTKKPKTELPQRYTPGTRRRATDRVQYVRADGEGRYTVLSGSRSYRVQLTTALGTRWATCTCANGKAKGGLSECWHTAAALIVEDA